MRQVCFIIAAVALSSSSLVARAQTTRVSEPVFGIQYNPKIVHFDKAPPLIGETCRDMRAKDLIVYAQLVNQHTRYFIVQEYLGEFGVAIAIRGTHCAEIDLDRFLYEGTDALAAQGVVVGENEKAGLMDNLAVEILTDYSKAFGGKDKFLSALGTRADNLPNCALRTELERFRKSR
jgi:hypothetical protein